MTRMTPIFIQDMASTGRGRPRTTELSTPIGILPWKKRFECSDRDLPGNPALLLFRVMIVGL